MRDINYNFDLNGNLTLQLADTEQDSAHCADTMGTRVKNHLGDEENRLLTINDNGFVSNYFYDAAGERTVKLSKPDLFVYVNSSEKIKGDSLPIKFVGYVSPYLVVTNGGRYTKHIYAGTQRIASKLGDIEAFGADPRRVVTAGHDVDNVEEIDFGTKYKNQNDAFKARFDSLGSKFNGKTLDDYVNGKSFCCSGNSIDEIEKNNTQSAVNAKMEDNLYFYHPDHLGSTSMVTNYDGEVTQNVAYIPYGEVFVEERNGSWATPFLFNAKELDEETGLYYYGARYLDPTSVAWLSVDLMQGKHPGMSPYNYCSANPIKLIDPDGRENSIYVIDMQDKNRKDKIDIKSLIKKTNAYFSSLSLQTRLHEVSAEDFDPSKMDATDSYVVVGSFDSKLKNSGKNPMSKMLNYIKKNMDSKTFEENFGDWYGGGINPERTVTNNHKFTKEIAIDGSGVFNYALKNDVDVDDFAAFIVMHAAGHTAGFNHVESCNETYGHCESYYNAVIMADGAKYIEGWLSRKEVDIRQLIFGGFQLWEGGKIHHNGTYVERMKKRYGKNNSISKFK